jgi:hypothetical protein
MSAKAKTCVKAKSNRVPKSSRARKRRLQQKQSIRLGFETLEDRRLLATFSVTNLNDAGSGSLRAAISSANNSNGADQITFTGSAASGVIALTSGELRITDDVTIDASGSAGGITIDAGDGADNIFNTHDGFRIFKVDDNSSSTIDVQLVGLTLTGGDTVSGADEGINGESGGAIWSRENLTLTGVTITANATGDGGRGRDHLVHDGGGGERGGSGGSGGGVFSTIGTLTIIGSTIIGNVTGDGGDGGECFFSTGGGDGGAGGHGGGVYSSGSTLTIIDTTISGNTLGNGGAGGRHNGSESLHGDGGKGGDGGGVFSSDVSLTITSSTISGNAAGSGGFSLLSVGPGFGGDGGGIHADGDATISVSTVEGNSTTGRRARGGGIFTFSGDLTLNSSTVSRNSATWSNATGSSSTNAKGGGIYSRGTDLTLANSTVSGNSATGANAKGGGIYKRDGAVTLASSTVSENNSTSGGGIHTAFADATLENTIVAGNTDSGTAPDLYESSGTLTVDYSLIGDTTGSSISAGTGTGNLLNQAALLGPLDNYGGSTETHAVLDGSPAIDAGDPSFDVSLMPNDQREQPFVRVTSGRIDIGSYEQQALDPSFFVVTTTNDELDFTNADFSLRELIDLANNSSPGFDTITFAASLSGQTITLGGSEIEITEALTIDATALDQNVTVDANNASRIFNITATTGDFTIAGLTLTGGNVTGDGGAIRSLMNVVLDQSTVSGNTTTGDSNSGAGIYTSSGDVTLISSTVSGNSATGAFASGGGIYTVSGSVMVTNSTVSGNQVNLVGAGIFTSTGDVTLSNSTVTENSAEGGGGVFIQSNGASPTLTIENSIVAGNTDDQDVAPDLFHVSTSPLIVNYSLIGDATGSNITAGTGTGNILNQSAQLGPLANNGGATQTHSLSATSPAVDAGDPGFDLAATPNDQRGALFARKVNTRVDIGAYEREGTNLVVNTSIDENDGDHSAGNFSLREAVALANSRFGFDRITFAPTLSGQTITLGGSEIEITEALRIDATALAANVTVDANDQSRIFDFTASTGTLTLAGLTLTGGRTTGNNANAADLTHTGGGIRFLSNSVLTLENSTVSGNSTAGVLARGGGVFSLGDVSLIRSTVSGNSTTGNDSNGGGVYTSSGEVSVTSSTVSGNSTAGFGAEGGGIYSKGAVTLMNSTIFDNHANGTGTIGGGIWNLDDPVVVSHSIVAGNTASGGMDDIAPGTGTLNVDYSLLQQTGLAISGSNNIIGQPANLGPLAYNGGPTQTHALLPGSPAMDAGDPNIVFDRSDFDQRGAGFTRVNFASIDIGAYEFQSLPPVFTSPSTANVDENAMTVHFLTATDADVPAQTVTFSITEGGADNARFDIIGGQLRFIAAPDFEVPTDTDGNNIYEVTVEADDGNGGITTQTIVVTVNPIDDNSPEFTSPTVASVSENTTAVHLLTATDADFPPPTFTFSVAGSGADNALFEIGAGNQLQFAAAPDFENPADMGMDNEYEVTVLADDGNGVTLPQTIVVTVINEAEPQTYIVDTTADENDGIFTAGDFSLREAIDFANNNLGADTILFDGSLSGQTITLGGTELEITEGLTIDATALGQNLTIDADSASRIFNITATTGDHRIAGLTLVGGQTTGDNADSSDSTFSGAAIRSLTAGNLILDQSTVSGNSATGTLAVGGGVFAYSSTVSLTNSTVSGNSSVGRGGGIYTRRGELTLTSSTVSGNSSGFQGGGIFASSGDVTLRDSNVSGNDSDHVGAGIGVSRGDVTLTESNVTGNDASSGGGISVGSGNVTLTESNVTGNHSSFAGAGIRVNSGDVRLTESNVTGNDASSGSGGGIAASGNVTLTESNVSGNTSFREGGGIRMYGGNVYLEDNSSVSENSSGGLGGGGIFGSTAGGNNSPSDVTLRNSDISGNSTSGAGGGIWATGDVKLTRSTVSGNRTTGNGSYGGGISTYSGDVTLYGSTVSGNRTTGNGSDGGGIRTFNGDVTLTSTTVSGNSATGTGGGVFVGTYGSRFWISNSIVAGNTDDGTAPDLRPLPTSLISLIVGHSLIGDTTGSSITAGTGTGNILNQPALLGPLTNNGGWTETHALLPGSPAIDAGSISAPAGSDQRGNPFVRVFDDPGSAGTGIDIGAFERQSIVGLTLQVDSVGDEIDGNYSIGNLTLREAIGLANGSVGAETITFDASLSGQTITLTGSELEITEALTIDAMSLFENLTIDADNASRIFNITATTGNITLAGLTLTGGRTTGDNVFPATTFSGGAIRSLTPGNLILERTTVSGNSTTGLVALGGGIFTNNGAVRLTDSTVSGNSTSGNFSDGGGIYTRLGAVTLTSSTVSGNSTSGNFADGGGIFTFNGAVTFTNSTVTENSAAGWGGGVYVYDTSSSPTMAIANSIIAGNTAVGQGPDLKPNPSGFLNVDYSLIGNRAGSGISAGTGTGNILNQPPRLGPLADNGGPTLTHALLPGSPAIDAGDPGFNIVVTPNDQRGAPRLANTRVDIGSYELHPLPPSVVDTAVDEFDGDYSSGDLSLREAIDLANNVFGTSTITFHPGLAGSTLILDSELSITDSLTIIGDNQNQITLDAGDGNDGVFGTEDGHRIFNISNGNSSLIDVTLSGLTLTGGDTRGGADGGSGSNGGAGGDGGAIRSFENLTIESLIVTGNATGSGGDGEFSQFSVPGDGGDGGRGGGIFSSGGVLTIEDSTIADNKTGGGGTSVGNSSGGDAGDGGTGGGIHSLGPTIITRSTIANNATGIGGNGADGSFFGGNGGDGGDGGGVFHANGELSILQSTISNNLTAGGGAAGTGGFSGGVAGDGGSGGGVHSTGAITLMHSTIFDNHANGMSSIGGGVLNLEDPVFVSHSIIAGNTAGGSMDDIAPGTGTLNVDYSLLQQAGLAISGSNNIIGQPANLGPLAYNGGPTQTHALLLSSPAINAGDPNFTTPPSTDQRGQGFDRVRNGIVDIGAFELETVLVPNFTVDTNIDEDDGDFSPGDLSLREAIGLANSNPGYDSIDFSAALSGTTIFLTGTELEITDSLTISAAALSQNITIDAQQNSRIFNITATTGDFKLAGLTLTGGQTTGNNSNSSDITFSGGAVRSLTTGSLTIEHSTVTGNSTIGSRAKGGGIFSRGELTVTSSTFSGNTTTGQQAYGGGILANDGLTLTNSTVSGNSTAGLFSFGGGIRSRGGDLIITQSTVSGNSTTGGFGDGGGIFTSGPTTITNSTITDNHAMAPSSMAGGLLSSFGAIHISNSIVAGNTASGGVPDISPSSQTLSINYSLIGTGVSPDAGTSGNNLVTDSPMLDPLADNGGPTKTHALLPGSLAIDAGSNALAVDGNGNQLLNDQRGAGFDRIFGGTVDIGAFEFGSLAFLLGDVNQSGTVDFLDITPFIGVLSSGMYQAEADIDGNGMVNFLDITPFISLLSSGGSSQMSMAHFNAAPAESSQQISSGASVELNEIPTTSVLEPSSVFSSKLNEPTPEPSRQVSDEIRVQSIAASLSFSLPLGDVTRTHLSTELSKPSLLPFIAGSQVQNVDESDKFEDEAPVLDSQPAEASYNSSFESFSWIDPSPEPPISTSSEDSFAPHPELLDGLEDSQIDKVFAELLI